jgi:predicted RNA methylase
MEEVFPYKEELDYNLLKTTDEGLYSITRRRDSEKIVSIIYQTTGSAHDKTVTDATACIGGDTIQFGLKFKKVHSIELNNENLEMLRNNIEVYDLKNVTLHHGDVTKIFNWHTDILYIDPPWGGPAYKENTDLDLMLGDTRLDVWLNTILKKKYRPSFIFLKLPQNYNFKRLNLLVNVDIIKPFRIRNYFLIYIGVHSYSKK